MCQPSRRSSRRSTMRSPRGSPGTQASRRAGRPAKNDGRQHTLLRACSGNHALPASSLSLPAAYTVLRSPCFTTAGRMRAHQRERRIGWITVGRATRPHRSGGRDGATAAGTTCARDLAVQAGRRRMMAASTPSCGRAPAIMHYQHRRYPFLRHTQCFDHRVSPPRVACARISGSEESGGLL